MTTTPLVVRILVLVVASSNRMMTTRRWKQSGSRIIIRFIATTTSKRIDSCSYSSRRGTTRTRAEAEQEDCETHCRYLHRSSSRSPRPEHCCCRQHRRNIFIYLWCDVMNFVRRSFLLVNPRLFVFEPFMLIITNTVVFKDTFWRYTLTKEASVTVARPTPLRLRENENYIASYLLAVEKNEKTEKRWYCNSNKQSNRQATKLKTNINNPDSSIHNPKRYPR